MKKRTVALTPLRPDTVDYVSVKAAPKTNCSVILK